MAGKIKTVVVLVQENRSFDHMLGWMKKSVNPEIDGVTGEEMNLVGERAVRLVQRPVKLRSTDAVEQKTPLSEFQEELVQLAAVLNGDHTKDAYPHKLVEGMTVADAANYCNDAFKAFLDECDRCKKCGEDGCYIPTLKPSSPPDKKKNNNTSFASKVLACLACGHAHSSSST